MRPSPVVILIMEAVQMSVYRLTVTAQVRAGMSARVHRQGTSSHTMIRRV